MISDDRLAEQHARYVKEINVIVSGLKYKWNYHGKFDDATSEGFAERLADRLISILKRFSDSYFVSLDCGPGWYRILASLDEELSYLCPDYEIQQIKEKFGTLRWYASYPLDHIKTKDHDIVYEIISSLVSYAEAQTSWTCEVCGNQGKLRAGAWVRCLCDKDYQPTEREI